MGSVKPGSDGPGGLRVLIAGAGIGGLATAIALRQQGHQVELFERSRFASEIGAAIHLTPNANAALLKLGIDATTLGGVESEKLRVFPPNGPEIFSLDIKKTAGFWRHRWLLVHRAHLHEGLKVAAQAPGPGIPAQLHTSSKVVDIDPHSATITLENGEVVSGDLVLGADGIHSAAKSKIPGGEKVRTFSSGKNAFRFLLARRDALDDPDTRELAKELGTWYMFDSPDLRVVVYPCANNELLNFVCIHPDTMSKIRDGSEWDQGASKESLLEVYKDFSPQVLKLLSKADPATLKVWPLLDSDDLPTWTEDRLAVLGDAAHPFLPYRASGGAMAIEDAISIGVMLPKGVRAQDVPERLKLYEKARRTRATTIQQLTRKSSHGPLPPSEEKFITEYIYGHDEYDHSTQILRKHLWNKGPQKYWRQPIVFGPMPGPRQDFEGRSRLDRSLKSRFQTTSIRFKTSRTVLQNLLPNESYSFSTPSTVATARISQTLLSGMDWLGGGGYRHLGLYIEGVQYRKADGEVINGTYLPILFESLADPIVSGREELGMPKLYSALDASERDGSYYLQASWQGAVWGRFRWESLEDEDPQASAGPADSGVNGGLLLHRYVPKVGAESKGQAEVEYPVFVPNADESKLLVSKVTRARKAQRASFEIDGLNWEALPTLHHIIERLAEIPVDEVLSATVVEGEGVPDVSSARRVE
ncbi:putative salicylate hydroxylase [Aspergillus lucknowensis]|uniref:FAD-binding domain-containing protein n=1 Tax=Aspergillus lucknowensis TaxID=176173 RepID=A0ABR4LRQ8_9EURO